MAPAFIFLCRLLGIFAAEQSQTGRGLPFAALSFPEKTHLRSPCVWKYLSLTQDWFFLGCLLLAHCPKTLKMAASTEPKVALLASCR